MTRAHPPIRTRRLRRLGGWRVVAVLAIVGLAIGATAIPALSWTADRTRSETPQDERSALFAPARTQDAALPMSALLTLAAAASGLAPAPVRPSTKGTLAARSNPATIARAPTRPGRSTSARALDDRDRLFLVRTHRVGARSDDIPPID